MAFEGFWFNARLNVTAAHGVVRAMRAVTLVNKGGGSFAKGAAERIEKALAEAGVGSEIVEVEGKDCAARAADHVKQGAELIIAAGGDGTMSAVAGELAESKAAMGILPLGTLNHFARDLGIPNDLGEAAKLIAAGHTRQVDVADVNGRTFVNNASIGLYPLMVMSCRPKPKPGAWNVGLLHHLHSGETFGPAGVIISILSGCSLFFFAFSGLWMYVQMWRGRLSLSQTGKKLRGGRFFWG